MRKSMLFLATIVLIPYLCQAANAQEIQHKPVDVRDKRLVFHIIPLHIGATPLTDRSRYGNDWMHSLQFTACQIAIFRTCGVGLTWGLASDKPMVAYNEFDPMGPLTLSNNRFTVAISFPVTTRIWAKTESRNHNSIEINFNTSPLYDLRLKRWTIAYGIGAAF